MSDPNYPQNFQQQPYGQPAHQPGYAPPGYGQQPMPYAQPGFTPRHKLPGAALAASIMWIIYGTLSLIGNLIGLAASGGKVGGGGVFGLAISAAFLVAGITTISGKAKGMLANGIVSIVLGGLVAIAFLLLGALIRGFNAPMFLIVIGLLFGGMLITAGILACMSNKAYKEFRATKGL
jgi:hypothetical protein